MRGENWVEARVRVISRIAKTIETTVMVEVAIVVRMACATWGSDCEGKSACGTNARISGNCSSSADRTAPVVPSASAISNGRMRNPPRRLYAADWTSTGSRLSIPKVSGSTGAASDSDGRWPGAGSTGLAPRTSERVSRRRSDDVRPRSEDGEPKHNVVRSPSSDVRQRLLLVHPELRGLDHGRADHGARRDAERDQHVVALDRREPDLEVLVLLHELGRRPVAPMAG